MPTTFIPLGDWVDLGHNHRMRFLKAGKFGGIIGGVLEHKVKGTDVPCEPGLVQWEPFGDVRPLFSITDAYRQPISITPFIVCDLCGDKGWIIDGKWTPKENEDDVDRVAPMKVLEATDRRDEGDHAYEVAVRRDLGDKVETEERDADRKLVDVSGRGGGDTVLKSPQEWCEELGIEIHDPDGWRDTRINPLRSFTEPISRAEFDLRVSISTVSTKGDERIIKGDGDLVFDTDAEDADDDIEPPSFMKDIEEQYHPTLPEPSDRVKRILEDNADRLPPELRPVKDSGHRHVFETGAQRDRAQGKGRWDLLQWLAFPRIALIMEKGADKYDARNWERGMPLSRFVDSAARHIGQFMAGMTDEDHLGQAGWNILSAIQTEEMIRMGLLPPELNDLPNYDPNNFDLTKRET